MAILGATLADELTGTLLADVISGLGGADVIDARSGADRVSGGGGGDTISGGEGADRLLGQDGDDVIFGFGSADQDPASANIVVTRASPAGFDTPLFAGAAPGDPTRLYVVEQHTGRIRILDTETGTVSAEPFLDIPDDELAPEESQGLLGLTFHPDYATNGRFFVHLTRADGDVEIRAYQRSAADPNRADPASGDVILVIDKDNGAQNHNGGWIGFGPDGLLYVSVGDEGESGDPPNNAQNVESLWGKMLRIDVDGDDFTGDAQRDYAIPDGNPFAGTAGADEIWALGLRNPWRASFDRGTGDFYIGDVGQAAREEINVEQAGSPGGANYGWKVREGRIVFDDTVPGNPPADSPELIDPVVDYLHDDSGGFAVVGGYVHRGEDAGMQGRYLYADFVTNHLWSFRFVDGIAVDVTDHTDQLVLEGGSFTSINSFAEDGNGNLYAVSIGGAVSRLRFGASSGDDADLINGGAGDDRLYGGAGGDRIGGGTGGDTIEGGAQGDVLGGGAGADRIVGGAGSDRIIGGADADILTGAEDADTFVFVRSSDADTIGDFQDDSDTIVLGEGFGFASAAAALAFAREVGDDVVFDFDGGQVLTVLGMRIAELSDDLIA